MASVRKGAVTLKGNPVDLSGPQIQVGDTAPDFVVQGADLADVTLASSAGKVRILLSVPSLDTPVCSIETKKFNDEATRHPDVAVLVVSTDLPFAQKRWCGAESATAIQAVSDHRDANFGEKYGVLIAGGPLVRCLARAVFVVGADNKVRHVEYVSEIANEPDYAAALAAATG